MVKTREHTPAKAGSSLRPVISLPLLITVTIVVYANAVPHDFVFDDRGYILSSPVISGFKSLSQTWFVLSQQWRPVTQLSYALTYYFAGFDATIFHLTNVCIHIINSLLIWGIARKVASRWLAVERAEAFALAAGLIHAVHPMYTEAVSYVWGRSSSLCALFYFGSLLLTMTAHEETGRKKSCCTRAQS